MKIAGIILITCGLIDLIYEKPASKAEKKAEKEIESKLKELQKSESENLLLLINNRKMAVGTIVLGLIFVLLD